jgi:hypothetical protein
MFVTAFFTFTHAPLIEIWSQNKPYINIRMCIQLQTNFYFHARFYAAEPPNKNENYNSRTHFFAKSKFEVRTSLIEKDKLDWVTPN